ncbi:MAG: hypothetical protein ACTSYX_09460 [Candidatus Thorarchaeota archaeon]
MTDETRGAITGILIALMIAPVAIGFTIDSIRELRKSWKAFAEEERRREQERQRQKQSRREK